MTSDFMINHIVENTGEKGSFHITFNQPKHYHQTVYDTYHNINFDEYVDGEGYESLEDFQQCFKTNVVWCVTWYPDNTVGSYTTYGSTLEKALGVMFNNCNEERSGE